MQAAILICCLKNYSSFFGELEDWKDYSDYRTQFHHFMVETMLVHLESVPYNAVSLDELSGLETKNEEKGEFMKLSASQILKAKQVQIGSAIYATISFINHSCYANVTRINDTSNGKMAIVALQNIREGEQLFTSYTQHFTSANLIERQNYLVRNYHFVCKCCACLEDWPTLHQLRQMPVEFICHSCYASRNYESDCKILVKRNRKFRECPSCKTKYLNETLSKNFKTNEETFVQCYDSLLANNPLNSVEKLPTCIEYFQSSHNFPCSRFFMSQDLLKRTLDTIVHYSQP